MAKFANFFSLLKSVKFRQICRTRCQTGKTKTVKLRIFATLEAKSNKCQIGAVKNCKTTNFCIIFVTYAVFVEIAVPV